MATVFDVAKYILEQQGATSALKLQKLVYYSQAWHFVWEDEELFPERIEAWAGGPVVPQLWRAHRGQHDAKHLRKGRTSRLSASQKESINAVLGYYGGKPARWLSLLTHQEPPWREARTS